MADPFSEIDMAVDMDGAEHWAQIAKSEQALKRLAAMLDPMDSEPDSSKVIAGTVLLQGQEVHEVTVRCKSTLTFAGKDVLMQAIPPVGVAAAAFGDIPALNMQSALGHWLFYGSCNSGAARPELSSNIQASSDVLGVNETIGDDARTFVASCGLRVTAISAPDTTEGTVQGFLTNVGIRDESYMMLFSDAERAAIGNDVYPMSTSAKKNGITVRYLPKLPSERTVLSPADRFAGVGHPFGHSDSKLSMPTVIMRGFTGTCTIELAARIYILKEPGRMTGQPSLVIPYVAGADAVEYYLMLAKVTASAHTFKPVEALRRFYKKNRRTILAAMRHIGDMTPYGRSVGMLTDILEASTAPPQRKRKSRNKKRN